MPGGVALAATIAWLLFLAVTVWRSLGSRRLEQYPATPPSEAPLLSVIIPARNEARNIARCVRSVLDSAWPRDRLEVVLVDDHSTDGTADVARTAAAGDARLRVIVPPPLPEGWFGKQWACHSGALAASGSLLCFTDADTRHATELLPRSVNAMTSRGADLFSVGGTQEMETFWEKVVQPFVFSVLLAQYGSMERMSRSTVPRRKIANGQYILVRRTTYDATGGHASVRAHVAEDLMLAQQWTARGLRVHMVQATDHLFTRMYTSFAELRRGWGKNVFAAGRDVLAGNGVMRALFPVLLPLAPLVAIIPLVVLGLALLGVLGPGALWFGIVAGGADLLFWMGAYFALGRSPLWGLTYPLGAATFSFICAEAAWRGSRVEWKGREYLSRSP